ncbi:MULTISPECIES: hypothetical protein [Porphyromonas]|uniref:hypothetical protein n=1 Tax=Porphyromonas TaxID=836 RepID=UPI000A8D09CB|nr:hypothetical protein [Porphyromonas gulae]
MNGNQYVPVAGSIGTCCKDVAYQDGSNLLLMSFEQLSERNKRIAMSIEEA